MTTFNSLLADDFDMCGVALAHFHIKGQSWTVMANHPWQRSWGCSRRNEYKLCCETAVMILCSQTRWLGIIGVCHNRCRSEFQVPSVGRYPLSFAKWICCTVFPYKGTEFNCHGKMTTGLINNVEDLSSRCLGWLTTSLRAQLSKLSRNNFTFCYFTKCPGII